MVSVAFLFIISVSAMSELNEPPAILSPEKPTKKINLKRNTSKLLKKGFNMILQKDKKEKEEKKEKKEKKEKEINNDGFEEDKDGFEEDNDGVEEDNDGVEKAKTYQLRFFSGIKKLPFIIRIVIKGSRVKRQDKDGIIKEVEKSIPIKNIKEVGNRGQRKLLEYGKIQFDTPEKAEIKDDVEKSSKVLVEGPDGEDNFIKFKEKPEVTQKDAIEYIQKVAVYNFSTKGKEIPVDQMMVVTSSNILVAEYDIKEITV